MMRFLASIFIALLLGVSPAWAWQQYTFLDHGFSAEFPTKPQVEKGKYTSALAKDLPTSIYTSESENVQYKVTVVDLGKYAADGSNFVAEAGYGIIRTGNVFFTDFPELYPGYPNTLFGITLVVDDAKGNRIRTSIYNTKKRLYLLEVTILAARGDKDMVIPSRLDQTVRFLPDGGRYDSLPVIPPGLPGR